MLIAQIITICHAYCFSAAAVVAQTHFKVTLCAHCLSCLQMLYSYAFVVLSNRSVKCNISSCRI